jgi:hypothetical protein
MALCEGYVILFFSNIVHGVGECIICCKDFMTNNIEDKLLATFVNLEFEVCVPMRMGTYFCTTRIHIDFGYYLQKAW